MEPRHLLETPELKNAGIGFQTLRPRALIAGTIEVIAQLATAPVHPPRDAERLRRSRSPPPPALLPSVHLGPTRFVVVGSPAYFATACVPKAADDLQDAQHLRHLASDADPRLPMSEAGFPDCARRPWFAHRPSALLGSAFRPRGVRTTQPRRRARDKSLAAGLLRAPPSWQRQ